MRATVTVDWLKRRLGSKRLAILDTRSRAAYLRSHIPGALHADLFHYFVPGTDVEGLSKFHDDVTRRVRRFALKGNETIVAYESGFGMRAARVAWIFEYSGFKNAYLLEGGFNAWRIGNPVGRRVVHREVTSFTVRPNPSIISSANSISSSGAKGALILDVRSEGEYQGAEKRDCCERYGRIPGAIWFEWTGFLHNQGGFLNKETLKVSLENMGLDPNKEIITYCHRGARAASAFYALRSLGYKRVRNYIGSWHEWSSRPDLPAETGPSEKP